MADPTTILALVTQRRDDAKQAVSDAQQRLARAQAAIATGNDDLAGAASAFADLEKSVADIRKRLSQIPTPADGAALLDALEQLIIRQRTERSLILKARDGLRAAQAGADRAQIDLTAASDRLAKAEAEVKQADQANSRRAELKKALAASPLSTIDADADGALKGNTFSAAGKRIKGDIPDKLLARARKRRAAEADRINKAGDDALAAEDAALAKRDKNGGLTGQAAKLWAAFLRAESAAKDLVDNGQNRLSQVQVMLADVGNPGQSPLTLEQAARINDPSLKVAREAAAAEEEARDGKLADLSAARAALDDAVLKARAANLVPDDQKAVKDAKKAVTDAEGGFKSLDDPWRAKEKDRDAKLAAVGDQQVALAQAIQKAIAANKDPDKDTAVKKARKDLDTAQQNLKNAEDAYKLSNHGILHAWEAAIPDSTWQLVDELEEASRILNALKGSNAGKLKTDLDKAEDDYVKAVLKADASAKVLDQLAAEQSPRAARRQIAREDEANHLFSALRGDN